jgi:hypothetical protein
VDSTTAKFADGAILTTATLSPCHEAELDKLARKIAALRLSVPVCFFLELHKPLASILHTAVLGLEPVAAPLINAGYWTALRQALSSRENIDSLIGLIERYAAEAG